MIAITKKSIRAFLAAGALATAAGTLTAPLAHADFAQDCKKIEGTYSTSTQNGAKIESCTYTDKGVKLTCTNKNGEVIGCIQVARPAPSGGPLISDPVKATGPLVSADPVQVANPQTPTGVAPVKPDINIGTDSGPHTSTGSSGSLS